MKYMNVYKYQKRLFMCDIDMKSKADQKHES